MAKIGILAGVTVALVVAGLAAQAGAGATTGPVQKGISYAGYTSGRYDQPYADLSLGQLAATGASWVSVIVTAYQPAITSTAISLATATPTDAELTRAITIAHSLGLKVMLKPHVDLSADPTHWRGQIGQAFATEAEWAAWFASYREFIGHYADIARDGNVEQFSVGTELMGTSARAADWRSVLAGIRSRYPGALLYASDWAGEADWIDWWDGLDYIGVDAHYPLTSKNDPTVAELNAAWAPKAVQLAALSARWGKSVVITEIGYQSRTGATSHPAGGPGALNLQEQSNAYQAAFESLYSQPWLAGLYWWFWGTDTFEGGPCDDNFTPHNKPAEDILRSWYGGPPRATSTPPPPDYGVGQAVYDDSLGSGWEDWSWDAARDPAATGQVYGGPRAISVTLGAYGALSLHHTAFDSSYSWLELYVRGASSGSTGLWVFFNDASGAELRKRPIDDCAYTAGGALEPDTWKRVLIPVSDLNPAGVQLSKLTLQERNGRAGTSLWIDEIRLVGGAWRAYVPLLLRSAASVQ